MKYLILFIALIMVSNVKASSYDEDIDYQTNTLRSFIQETVEGVPTNQTEPLDFSLSDLPLRENTEDVGTLPYDKYRTTTEKVGDFVQDSFVVPSDSDYVRYAMKKGFRWNELDDESLYVLGMYVSKFIGMVIPWVILFFVLRKYIFYKPKYLVLLFGSYMLYWVGISANEIQHDSYDAFDRVPLEYKMYSPKFRNILELVQRKKNELTPEQQLEYANSLARSEFGKDTTFSVLGALTIATDTFGDAFFSGFWEGGATYLKGKTINYILDDWGYYYKDESATTDEIINSAVMGSVIGGGVSAVFFLFGLIVAVKNYIQKRTEKKNTDNTVSDTNVEQTSPTNANEVNDVSKQPQEQTHVFDKGVRKNMNKKINHFFVILFLFIITILVCYWLGYLFSDFTKEFLTIFVKHRNLFSPIGFRVLLSIFMLIGILYLYA